MYIQLSQLQTLQEIYLLQDIELKDISNKHHLICKVENHWF